jgi:hypothetical protein
VHSSAPPQYHRGSCLCGPYELRLTRRCLTEDLNFDQETEFSPALSHPIVDAFKNQRSLQPTGSKTVGPVSGEHTIYRLGSGHHHRGATWFDQHERVVWLCAYRLHRSGHPDDAFPYFNKLIRSGRIMPTRVDYETLFTERDRRFVETLSQDAQALLARAHTNPGVEVVGLIGGEERTGVIVQIVETLEETNVAFALATMDYTRIVLILAAFIPEATFKEWELVPALPTRSLREKEVCYRILRGSAPRNLM